ncbi:MAG: tRNA (adenosine(37)-N6)-threonylcarbamoyltransferase complex dimerization subunit type 1 TsaB [Chloroflexi bacterium]|nr:tRNA (adenosine(37)-N6)-threonylcarbamoyltransferase complex dimerization subunit type 1 TsaB [Chloroflexota bacterium]
MLLAIDTATDFASIALYDGAQALSEYHWRSHRRHTVELAPRVDRLLREQGLKPNDLTALAVAIGPGSYTGVRVGLSLAKGVVLALNLPIIGVPTLDVAAYPHLDGGLPVCALAAAGRRRYGWAIYAAGERPPQRVGDWRLGDLEQVLAQVKPPLRFTGELSPTDRARLREMWGDEAIITPPALSLRRAGVLAELAWMRLQTGEVDDPVMLSPIYL